MFNGIVSNVNRGNFNVIDAENKSIIKNVILSHYVDIYPVVGDKVYYDFENNTCIIFKIFPRKNQLSRTIKDMTKFSRISSIDTLCSNIDYLFIFSSLNDEFNPDNIEKFVKMAIVSNIIPVIILTKIDLLKPSETQIYIDTCLKRFPTIDVIGISTKRNINLDKLSKYFKNGLSIALLGNSGVGKSTFINHIIGENLRTNDVDKHDNGRHTTTSRNLYITGEGTLIIDMPGIKLANTSNEVTKNYIKDLATLCKSKACTHTVEEGCELLKALKNKIITNHELKEFRRTSFSESKTQKNQKEKYSKSKNRRKQIKSLRQKVKFNSKSDEE